MVVSVLGGNGLLGSEIIKDNYKNTEWSIVQGYRSCLVQFEEDADQEPSDLQSLV